MSVDGLLEAGKALMEYGVVGACLLLAILWCRKMWHNQNRIQDLRLEDERRHGDEKAEMERRHARELYELADKSNRALTGVNETLAELVTAIGEDN